MYGLISGTAVEMDSVARHMDSYPNPLRGKHGEQDCIMYDLRDEETGGVDLGNVATKVKIPKIILIGLKGDCYEFEVASGEETEITWIGILKQTQDKDPDYIINDVPFSIVK